MEMTLPESYRLLTDCLKKDGGIVESSRLSGLSPEGWQTLLETASTQRMKPLLWYRLGEKGLREVVPSEVAEALQNAFRRNTLRNMRFYGELRNLLSALKSEGIPLILLKGIFLADAVYDHIGLREMGDVDVLARVHHLSRIAEILKAMGYEPARAMSEDFALKTQRHIAPMVKNGVSFEVHWNLTAPDTYYTPTNPDDLWERAVPVQVVGCDATALSSEDLLIYLCLHCSYLHRFNCDLRFFYDISETISCLGSAIDWDVLVERVLLNEWQRGVYLALSLAIELSDAKVPAAVRKKLRPAGLTDEITKAAFSQISTNTGLSDTITVPCATFLESKRLRDKIRLFWKRVFLPKAAIATMYSIPENSMRIYGCYPRRAVDLLWRHGPRLGKFLGQDDFLVGRVRSTNHIVGWLSGKQKDNPIQCLEPGTNAREHRDNETVSSAQEIREYSRQ